MFFKKILSIDIGTKNIKLVVGYEKKNIVNVKKILTIPTPENAYEDGQFLSTENLRKEIEKTLNENKIKVKNCIFTLQSTSVITRELVLPMVKKEELKSMIILEVEQYLPIVIDEYIVEYKILEELEENDVKKLRIMVIVLSKKIVETYLKFIKEMKLIPVALDIHANSISKLFDSNIYINDEKYRLKETVAVIDLGNSYINVKIIDRGHLRFNRIILHGGKDIDMAIANSYNLSIDGAEKRKIKNNGLLEDIEKEDSIIIKSDIDSWILEIQRIFRYYTSRNISNKVDKIFLYGGNSNIKGIVLYISQSLNIPTFKIEKMSNISFDKNCHNTDLNKHLNGIAAIIRR